MKHAVILIPLLLTLSGCGLGEVAGTAATQGAAKAEELKQARKTEQKIEQRLDDANRAAAEQKQAAERALE